MTSPHRITANQWSRFIKHGPAAIETCAAIGAMDQVLQRIVGVPATIEYLGPPRKGVRNMVLVYRGRIES
jgi:hypothetical protein